MIVTTASTPRSLSLSSSLEAAVIASMLPTPRATSVVAGIVVAAVVGCAPSRQVIAPRATPATVTVAVDVTLADGTAETVALQIRQMNANRHDDDSAPDDSAPFDSAPDDSAPDDSAPVDSAPFDSDAQLAQAMAWLEGQRAEIEAQLKADLGAKNIAVVVRDPAVADLQLHAVLRRTGMNQNALDWSLVDEKTSQIVRSGVTEDHPFAGGAHHADQVIATLVGIDLARFGAAPPPAVATPTPTTPTIPTTSDPRSTMPGDNTWAIVVGIERYRDALPVATFAENDARAFAAWLETTLNVPPTHIKLLVGDRASRADLASAIEEWLPRNARTAGGRVYVYFSGHGAPDPETGTAYLVPWDADPAYLKTRGYAIDALTASLAKLPSQESFVFLDACFSGSGERSVLAAGTRPLVPVRSPTPPKGRLVAYAAASSTQTTGGWQARGHGLFTGHLLDALRGASDENVDGTITVDEVARYVAPRVGRDARLQNREQTPVLTVPTGAAPAGISVVTGVQR
jgi:hypothetical protein